MRSAMILLAVTLLAGCIAPTPSGPDSPAAASLTRSSGSQPAHVAAVLAGLRKEASAVWWGFDPEDATDGLQAAIDSGVPVLRVPDTGQPWNVRPLFLRSDQIIILEAGVVIQAKAGEFISKGDNLLSAESVRGVTLLGYGATLRMRKADYQQPPYEKSEWRHAVSLNSVREFSILGLTIESSGGDGIYIGVNGRSQDRNPSRDVVIRDVVLRDHHRQGISVVSAKNLLVEKTTLTQTSGTAPSAGIDFEPNRATEVLENCVVRGCTITDNAGAGVQVFLRQLDQTSAPISITIEDCVIRGNTLAVWVTPAGGEPSGRVRFTRSQMGRPRLVRRTKQLEVLLD